MAKEYDQNFSETVNVEYQKERERQAADQAEELKKVLGDSEDERNRRKK